MAVESENDFRVDLHCVNPGQTTVRLRVEITDHQYQQAHTQALLQDDVTFEVRIHNHNPLTFSSLTKQKETVVSVSQGIERITIVFHLSFNWNVSILWLIGKQP